MIKQLAFVLAVALIVGAPLLKAEEQARPTFVLGVPERGSDIMKEYFAEVSKVYEQLGYKVIKHSVPTRRMMVEADRGKIDGAMLIPKIVEQHYSNLYRIDAPLASIDMIVLSQPKIPDIVSIEDLNNYRIGYLMGYETTDRVVRNMNATPVRSYDLLFKMVTKERLDVVLILRRESYRFVAKNPQFAMLKMHPKALYELKLYHFINKKHLPIQQQVTELLREQLATGNLNERVKAKTPNSPFLPYESLE